MAVIVLIGFAILLFLAVLAVGRSNVGASRSPGEIAADAGNAGFGVRFIAFCIDGLLLTVVVVVFDIFLPIPFVGVFVSFAYFTMYWAASGATPGMKALRLRLVGAASNELIAYPKALLRCAGYVVAAVPLGLGFVWIIWDRQQQGWHDKIAGTRVIRVAPVGRDERTVIT